MHDEILTRGADVDALSARYGEHADPYVLGVLMAQITSDQWARAIATTECLLADRVAADAGLLEV